MDNQKRNISSRHGRYYSFRATTSAILPLFIFPDRVSNQIYFYVLFALTNNNDHNLQLRSDSLILLVLDVLFFSSTNQN